VGGALIYSSHLRLVPFAIGTGMVAYAIAVAFYTLLAIWRIHRSAKKLKAPPGPGPNGKRARVDDKSLTAPEPVAAWGPAEDRPEDKIF
jgi:hypothetical protein